jgi:hypothetical protein
MVEDFFLLQYFGLPFSNGLLLHPRTVIYREDPLAFKNIFYIELCWQDYDTD